MAPNPGDYVRIYPGVEFRKHVTTRRYPSPIGFYKDRNDLFTGIMSPGTCALIIAVKCDTFSRLLTAGVSKNNEKFKFYFVLANDTLTWIAGQDCRFELV